MIATALLLLVPLSAAPTPPATFTPCSRTVLTWIGHLQSEDRNTQQTAYENLLKTKPKFAVSGLTKLLAEKKANVYQVVEILGAIGPDAKEAVPALLALLPKEGSLGSGADTIAMALAKIDGPKIEATRALMFATVGCRTNASVLPTSQTLREYPSQVVQHMVALCADKDEQVRMRAATFLGTLKERATGRCAPPSLLERAGDSAKGAVPALDKLLADENAQVRLAAARAIVRLAPELTDKALTAVAKAAEKTPAK